MRLGFFLGFLLGAGLASFLSMAKRAEAPDDAALLSSTPSQRSNQVLDKIKQQAREAREASKEAAMEKEAEMLRAYDEAVHRKPEET